MVQLGLGNFNPTSAPVFLQDMAKNSSQYAFLVAATSLSVTLKT